MLHRPLSCPLFLSLPALSKLIPQSLLLLKIVPWFSYQLNFILQQGRGEENPQEPHLVLISSSFWGGSNPLHHQPFLQPRKCLSDSIKSSCLSPQCQITFRCYHLFQRSPSRRSPQKRSLNYKSQLVSLLNRTSTLVSTMGAHSRSLDTISDMWKRSKVRGMRQSSMTWMSKVSLQLFFGTS